MPQKSRANRLLAKTQIEITMGTRIEQVRRVCTGFSSKISACIGEICVIRPPPIGATTGNFRKNANKKSFNQFQFYKTTHNMSMTTQVAKHLRDVYFGGNWTSSCLKEHLASVTWEQATTKVHSFNTIATLVFHVHYYIGAVSKVLQGGPLDAKDKYSFDHPPILSQADWDSFLDTVWADAENFAALIEQLPDSKLAEPFSDGKYGNYFRNLVGIIEHTHYHLGQIVLVKKLLPMPNQPEPMI